MIKISVKHKIGDIVEHSFNSEKFKVVGYNYVIDRGTQYICLQSDKIDYAYMSDCELKSDKECKIGFIIRK